MWAAEAGACGAIVVGGWRHLGSQIAKQTAKADVIKVMQTGVSSASYGESRGNDAPSERLCSC